MCGVAGILDIDKTRSKSELVTAVERMCLALTHRGPDDSGLWVHAESGIALGHQRLSILDLSAAGKQPMISRNGRFVISYNGEVYNANELRTELERKGHVFRGHSDTEVIVEGCASWGVQKCVERLNGMFALAIWDCENRSLSLVRDRAGIKPLYWGFSGSTFLFGSELKAFRSVPGWRGEIDRNALSSYMRHGYVPSPLTIYRGIQKLLPAHILTIDSTGGMDISCYWDIRAIARKPRTSLDPAEAADQLDALLQDAVKRAMASDVPLGAFLSGGIDSSLTTALMQAASDRPIRTFTIGFEDHRFDEASYAKAVAAHLKTDHTELYVENRHLLDVVPKLSSCFDEPFADPSQIPTYLLAELTRKQVTVALSGDGGDELFGGYTWYSHVNDLWSRFQFLPKPVMSALGFGVEELSKLGSKFPAGMVPTKAGDKLQKLAGFLSCGDPQALYFQLISHWPRPDRLVLHSNEPHGTFWDKTVVHGIPSIVDQVRLLDFLTYLPDHVLTKVDRTTMAFSLEARVPLLDHRVAEFAWSLPVEMHMRGKRGKLLLRQVLNRYLPSDLVERPKRGFVPPLGNWLRGPLRSWAEALIDETRLRAEGYLDPQLVQRRWRDHVERHEQKADSYSPLWNVIAFQAWLEAEKVFTVTAQKRRQPISISS